MTYPIIVRQFDYGDQGRESHVGCFPVGPECIKKVPKKYRIKWKQEG